MRIMFVVMMLLCLYCSWTMNWIRQRHAYLEARSASGVSYKISVDYVSAPWSLRIFQEPGVAWIDSGFGAINGIAEVDVANKLASDTREMDVASRLFPEAKIFSLDIPFNPDDFSPHKPSRFGNGKPIPYYQNGAWVYP